MFTCFSVQNGLPPPFYPIISSLYFKILNHFLLEEACFYICFQNIYPSCILVSLFFYSFKIKWREQVINSITSFEKCHAVHEKGALPNVKLRGWDGTWIKNTCNSTVRNIIFLQHGHWGFGEGFCSTVSESTCTSSVIWYSHHARNSLARKCNIH